MQNELNLIESALRKANRAGAFELEESAQILHCLNVVKNSISEMSEKIATFEGKESKVIPLKPEKK